MKRSLLWIIGAFLLCAACRDPVPVTTDNFARAETQWHFARFVERGALGGFYHFRRLGITDQSGIQPNPDAYHSVAVFDLEAGPVTIFLPDVGERFMSMSVINETNHVVATVYTPGPHVYTSELAGSRYMVAIVRFFVDGEVAIDSQIAHDLQDAIGVKQAGPGSFEVQAYDSDSRQRVRESLRSLAAKLPGFNRAAGNQQEVDSLQHLAATAMDWGLPDHEEAQFLHGRVAINDGSGVFELLWKHVPSTAFWSVSLYDSAGGLQHQPYEQYTINNTNAHVSPGGAIIIQLGGCNDGVDNCLPIFPGWQYVIRLYRPAREVVDGNWEVPAVRQIR